MPSRIAIGLMFLWSGAVALIYEGVWQRQFTLLFGSSAPASAAVLAAYFAGMGLGAMIVGIRAGRWRKPLIAYGCLEGLVAVGALLVTPLMGVYASHYPQWFDRWHGSGTFLWLKGALAFVSILLPTFALGGTLPVLARLFEARREEFGQLAGWLYLLNTIGAAGGALSFPLLLRTFGLTHTNFFCVVVNIVIMLAAFAQSRRMSEVEEIQSGANASRPALQLVLALAFISGLGTFALQVGWNRAFAQIHENSVDSFSLIVGLFILAIAAGAQLARFFLKRGWAWRRVLGRCWLIGGLLIICSPLMFLAITNNLKFVPLNSSLVPRLILPAALVFVPVMLVAVSLPSLFQALASSSGESVGRLTGTVLAVNIAGSVLGALLAGFVLPVYLGLWQSLIGTGALITISGAILLFSKVGWRVGSIIATCALVLFFSRANLPRTRVDAQRGENLLALREGAHGIVAVVEQGPSRRLKLNNHYVLGGTAAVGDERLQGHLPLLLHPNPQRVAFLGYGSGITAGAALFHASTNVLALELVPEVVDLAAIHFAEANNQFGSKRRVIVEDARNFMRGTTERFDVVIGDLVVPWRHGEGALYTLEHFQAVKQKMSGVYCCWVPLFQLSKDDFETVLRTFLKVFPEAQIWRGDFSPREPALGLVAYASEASYKEHLENMQPDPTNPHLRFSSAFWMHFVGTIRNLPAGELNTEDRPIIELRGGPLNPFVGRELAAWERELRRESTFLGARFTRDQQIGWEGGELMREYALLYSEGREAEAQTVARGLRALLGEEAAQAVFGP
ncbi:MAG TPA: hypothetical protein VF773_17330 [Verrucomicrobiae bacterium]